jgi:hypothetical protein
VYTWPRFDVPAGEGIILNACCSSKPLQILAFTCLSKADEGNSPYPWCRMGGLRLVLAAE